MRDPPATAPPLSVEWFSPISIQRVMAVESIASRLSNTSQVPVEFVIVVFNSLNKPFTVKIINMGYTVESA